MQSKTNSITTTIALGAVFGFAGLFAMPLNGWVGGILFVIGIGILLSKYIVPPKVDPIIPQQHTIFSEFELTEELQAVPNAVPKARASREAYQPLLAKVATSGRNVNAPVLFVSDNQQLTARDIIVEIAMIAEEHDEKPEALTEKICDMFDLFWDYMQEAMEQEKFETLDQYRVYIATSAYFKFNVPEAK